MNFEGYYTLVALAEFFKFRSSTSLPAYSTDLRGMLPRRTFSGKFKEINIHVFYAAEMIIALS